MVEGLEQTGPKKKFLKMKNKKMNKSFTLSVQEQKDIFFLSQPISGDRDVCEYCAAHRRPWCGVCKPEIKT